MIKFRLLIVAAPVGAACLGASIMIPYWVFTQMGDMMKAPPQPGASPGGLATLALVGFAGVCLLSVGMIFAALKSWAASSRSLLLIGGLSFLTTAPLVGYANTQLSQTFRKLAMAEQIQVDAFVNDVNAAYASTLMGFVGILVGSSAVFCASWTPGAPAERNNVRLPAVVTAVGSSMLVCLAHAWQLVSVGGFEATINASQPVKPAVMAGFVTGMLMSVYISIFALVGFGGVAILLGLAARSDPDTAQP